MRTVFLSITALIILPAAASAHSFTTARPIELPTLRLSSAATIELDADALKDTRTQYLVVDESNRAIASTTWTNEIDLLPEAHVDVAPAAADTLPQTRLDMLRDGDDSTFFQPTTARDYVFRFHFIRPVAPSTLELHLTEGALQSVHVRLGESASSLKDAAVGSPSSSTITLSGELAKVFEVTIRINEGVLRIAEMRLLSPKTSMTFLALPKKHYVLLYGGYSVPLVESADFTGLLRVQGVLGEPRELSPEEKSEDFDGMPAKSDNCPAIWNPDQKDSDSDGIGDSCDNCPTVSNPLQEDSDHNGRGNVCEDPDNDGVIKALDNCPMTYNPQQLNDDLDGTGNVCDTSDDRWSEQRPWLLYASMGLIALVLTGLGGVILRQSSKK